MQPGPGGPGQGKLGPQDMGPHGGFNPFFLSEEEEQGNMTEIQDLQVQHDQD